MYEYVEMIPPKGSHLITFSHILRAPLAQFPCVIQASVWIPRSIHWLWARVVLTADPIYKFYKNCLIKTRIGCHRKSMQWKNYLKCTIYTFIPVLKPKLDTVPPFDLLPCKLTCSMCQNSNVLHKYLKKLYNNNFKKTTSRLVSAMYLSIPILIDDFTIFIKISNIYFTCLLDTETSN